MATFIQEVLSLLARKKTVKTLEPNKDYFQLGRRRDGILITAGYNPEMDPYTIKADDFICTLISNIVSGNPNYIPVISPVPVSPTCPTGGLVNSHIYQDPLGGTIHIYNQTAGIPTAGSLNYALTVANGDSGLINNYTVRFPDEVLIGRPRRQTAPNSTIGVLVFGRAALTNYAADTTDPDYSLIAIGDQAAQTYNPTGSFAQDIIIGNNAAYFIGNNNSNDGLSVIIGAQALLSGSSSENVIIGHSAAFGDSLLSETTRSIIIGYAAAANIQAAFDESVAIGYVSLASATSTQGTTAVGALSGATITVGINNTFLGYGSGYGITTGSGNTILGGHHAGPLSSSLTNHILILNGNGNQRITVDDLGRTGLNEATPSAWLDVRGTGTVYPMLSLESSDFVSFLEYTAVPSSGSVQWHVGISQGGNNGTDNIMYFISDNTGATPQAFSIQRLTGNVGIGTYAPDTKLRVVGEAKIGTNGYLRLFDGAGGSDVRSESGGLFIGTNLADPVDFYTDDVARLRVDGTGNVGIGYGTGPYTHLLDVNGDVGIVNHLYDSSNSQGLAGQVLTKTASGQLWQTPVTSGTVTSVDGSGGTTGLTLSGGPITSSGTLTLGGTLVAANGGTGLSSYAIGDILYANTTTSLAALGPGAAGTVLSSNGPGVAPSWIAVAGTGTVTSVDLSTGTTGLTVSGGPITSSGTFTLSGTLAIGHGGTGITSYAQGDILYGNASGGLSKLSPGTAGQVLSTNGAGADPSWIAVGGTGTVTSVDVSGGTTGLTFSGGPITTSGTITASGTLDTANGGTGTNAGTLADLQDYLGLKRVYIHYSWVNLPSAPYFNFSNGVLTEVPFNVLVNQGILGTATLISVANSTTQCRFNIQDTGYYRITFRLHFYDQTNDVDCTAWIYDDTLGTPVHGIIDDKSSEASSDKLLQGIKYTTLNAGTAYSIKVLFSGGAVNPFPSDANQMVTEVIIESVEL